MKHAARGVPGAKENREVERQLLLKHAAFPSPGSSAHSSGPPSPERTTSPRRPARVSDAVAHAHRRLRSSTSGLPSKSAPRGVYVQLIPPVFGALHLHCAQRLARAFKETQVLKKSLVSQEAPYMAGVSTLFPAGHVAYVWPLRCSVTPVCR